LAKQGISDEDLANARDEAEQRISQYVDDAHAAPWPEIADAFTDVQDVGAPEMGIS